MKKHIFQSELKELKKENLSKDQLILLEKAKDITSKAYAPYSKFKVGAAIILSNGEIITASNQENAAYPSGLCAERAAFFYAGSNFSDQKIKKIAIFATAKFKFKNTIMPCGACRQSMIEYEQKQGEKIEMIIQAKDQNIFISESISNLLPYAFQCEELKK